MVVGTNESIMGNVYFLNFTGNVEIKLKQDTVSPQNGLIFNEKKNENHS